MSRHLDDVPRRNAPAGHIEREMTRLFRARKRGGVPVWDLPHYFMPVHWDGRKMWTGEQHRITFDVHPDAIPGRLSTLAQQEVEAQLSLIEAGELPTLYAYLLVYEAYGVEHDPQTATELEKKQLSRDRVQRRYHERPDAMESCDVMAADIDGRFWMANRRRTEPHRIVRKFWPNPDSGCIAKDKRFSGAPLPSGQFTKIMRGIAMATASFVHGDRMPGPGDRMGIAEVVSLQSVSRQNAMSTTQERS